MLGVGANSWVPGHTGEKTSDGIMFREMSGTGKGSRRVIMGDNRGT